MYAIPEQSAVGPGDRLSLSLFLAVIVHAIVILGVTFKPHEALDKASNTLDIVLVQHRSREAPEDAKLLAQADQDGGGDSELFERPSTPLPAPMISTDALVPASSPPTPAVRDLRRPPELLAMAAAAVSVPKPRALLAARNSTFKRKVFKKPTVRQESKQETVAEAKSDRNAQPAPALNAATLMNRSLAMASLSAELDKKLREYSQRPRRKWITSRTREYKYAAYMDSWRAKVERIGNLNYPDSARRKRISGSLLLDVALNADGSINEIVLRRSSGRKMLDDAAMRIVKLAAPFAPLPKNIRKETDILHIQRTWQFLADARLASR